MTDSWAAIESDFLVSVANFASGSEAKAAFVAFAAEKRDEAAARYLPSSVTTFVDGAQGAPLTAVKLPNGTIRFEFGYLREVVAEIFNMLIAASPYRAKRPNASPSTNYKDVHMIYVNGSHTDDITNLPLDAVVTFVNLQPYARKIERGLSFQAPTGVYQMVARLARAKYGRVLDIAFGYDVFPHAGPQTLARRRPNVRSKADHDDRFPSITVQTAK